MEADKGIFYNNPDKNKGERYQAWLKVIKTDMHIDKSVKIVDAIVHAQVQTALK
jgi:carboxyl-terminal processing protease